MTIVDRLRWPQILCAFVLTSGELDGANLTIAPTDNANQPLPARVHLTSLDGAPVRVTEFPYWHGHFVCPGAAAVDVPAGRYVYEVERGPEYLPTMGVVVVDQRDGGSIAVTPERISNLREQGWYSADLHVHRDPADIELLMSAEDLDFAPVITWWNNRDLWRDMALPSETVRRFDGHRLYELTAGEDEREGGALLYFRMRRPIDITGANREHPSPLRFVAAAKASNPRVWNDIEKPFWWDVPVWVAHDCAQSIGLANNHMCRSAMLANEAWGRPRDAERLPSPRGNGYWSQEIYYHLLNAGIRLPPSAGSASGVLPNPVGYNRVYVHIDGEFSYDSFWNALGQGRSFVTNGPLLIGKANGHLPGHEFEGDATLKIDIELSLTSKDRIAQVEIIKNGAVVSTLLPSADISQSLAASVEFIESGWFLVRAIADNEETFRFASTAPYYVKIGEPRTSRRSAEFFLQWARERADRLRANLTDANQLAEVFPYHEATIEFWQRRVAGANAE